MTQKLNILIVGGSSFIAKSFLLYCKGDYNIKRVVRKQTHDSNEVVIKDFSTIPDEVFKNIDVVINCAAIVHQTKQVEEQLYYDVNHILAVNLAKKAKQNSVKIFLQFSTIAVYGKLNFIDSKSKEIPISSYGKSKWLADYEILNLTDNSFSTLIIRPPMVYGNHAPGNMQRLIHVVNKGLPLPFANADKKRDFINIKNLVGYMEAAISVKQTMLFPPKN